MTGNRQSLEQTASGKMLTALSRHGCTGCGACCRWPGHVYLYREDLIRIARRLKTSVENFLKQYCVVVKWKTREGEHFRIGIARNSGGSCVFLRGSKCGIHDHKPLACKAGPAGWPWIANPDSFWYYVEHSPSFRHPEGALSLAEANQWFRATRNAEADASRSVSLNSLATLCGVPVELVMKLRVVDF